MVAGKYCGVIHVYKCVMHYRKGKKQASKNLMYIVPQVKICQYSNPNCTRLNAKFTTPGDCNIIAMLKVREYE